MTQDPLPGFALNPQMQNPYPYALSNPVIRVDPTGLASETIGPCRSDLLIALAIIHVAVILAIVVPAVFFLSNPSTVPLGLILLEYVALPIELPTTLLTLHACGVI